METKEISHCLLKLGKWAVKYRRGLLMGGILSFSVTAAYLLSSKKKQVSPLQPKKIGIDMERYVFDIQTDGGLKAAVVESGGDCYTVTLDGRYIGSMWRDEERVMQWNTLDEELTPHLSDIASLLSEAFSRKGFPSLLKGAYPEIISTGWKSTETLEVVISPETDLEVFSTFLKDEVLNLVDFGEHLDLMVKKADNAYFVIVGVN
ncbi:hypothetical protein [Pedobacter sp. R-06]|uniref:hypothetical protein n=1 Tax=Pedobacter sp. R-06 TaxID=3404051 RepID=UPI003CF2876A